MSEFRERDIPSDWLEYRRLVLSKLEALEGSVKDINGSINVLRSKEMQEMWIEINLLKLKSGVWGFAAGLIPALLALVVLWLSKKGF